MPHHKSQHFVPKCYLRNFSSDENRASINVANYQSGKIIPSASIKKQCAKDYFYGEDLLVEKSLQPLEGNYASISQKVIRSESISVQDLDDLKDFCFLQYLRTDIAAQRTLHAQAEMLELISPVSGYVEAQLRLSEKEVTLISIKNYVEARSHISDLKVCIFRNKTKRPFVTSDDPCVLINRFYSQKLGARSGSAGIGNSGSILIMPVSPKYCIISYDPGVYTITDQIDHVVDVRKINDIEALNELQYLKSAYNIYFSDWADRGLVGESLARYAPSRPDAWHKLHYAIEDKAYLADGSRRFRTVHTLEERMSEKNAIIHMEILMLVPSVWASAIKFRNKMKFTNTGTGAGYIRSKAI